MPTYELDNVRAQSSIKSLNFELSNLTPSALITLFEIDISKLVKSKNTTLAAEQGALKLQFPQKGNLESRIDLNDNILRFHNNLNVFNSYIIWQGKVYHPAPIAAEGFESTTKGTLPQPSLTISSQSETGMDQLALLKHEIRKFGDIIGSKVTRRRTFAKYLDKSNFRQPHLEMSEKAMQMPQGFEPDPYAELPKDVYFIERKQTENKTVLTYQLSSVLDLEGTKVPKRVINADKCVWQYRGIGCWYQHATKDEIDAWEVGTPKGDAVPLLKKAELNTIHQDPESENTGLPKNAPPVANDKDERLAVGKTQPDKGLWEKNPKGGYKVGDYCYIEDSTDTSRSIKYYFVCKKENGGLEVDAILPPNSDYWDADECSKTLTGCRLRWGDTKGMVNLGTNCAIGVKPGSTTGTKGLLPFGGFPAARKLQRQG